VFVVEQFLQILDNYCFSYNGKDFKEFWLLKTQSVIVLEAGLIALASLLVQEEKFIQILEQEKLVF